MSTELVLQMAGLVLGSWFTYIGLRTLFSKKYYVTEVEETSGKTVDEAYKSLPSWRRIYTRFGLGGKWLIAGVALLVLFVYSLLK